MAYYINRSGAVWAAQIGEWTVQTRDFTKRVWQRSCIRLVYYMQMPASMGGNMPVDTGFLRSSLRASTSPVAIATVRHPGGRGFLYFPNRIEDVIMGITMGRTLFMGYEAEYANVIEYGGRHTPARGFQRLAVQRWSAIVDSVIAEMKSGVGE